MRNGLVAERKRKAEEEAAVMGEENFDEATEDIDQGSSGSLQQRKNRIGKKKFSGINK